MMEFLYLYRYVFILLLFMTPLLAFTGVHLPARSQTLKTLMMSQMAALGLLLGIFLGELLGLPELFSEAILPLCGAVIVALLVSTWSRRFDCSAGESFYLVLYLLGLASTYLLCSVLPGLEVYQTQLFFGDVVTISGMTLALSILLAAILLTLMVIYQREFLKNSMDFELLIGQNAFRPKADLYGPLSLGVIILGMYSLGMLFTLSAMLVAPVLLHYRSTTLKNYLLSVVLVSTLAAVLGLTLSLTFSKLSTVALMVVLNAFFCMSLLIFAKKKS